MPGEGQTSNFTLESFVGRQRMFWVKPPIHCTVYPEYGMVTREVNGKPETKQQLLRWVCEVIDFGIKATHLTSATMAKLAINDMLADVAMSKTKQSATLEGLKARMTETA